MSIRVASASPWTSNGWGCIKYQSDAPTMATTVIITMNAATGEFRGGVWRGASTVGWSPTGDGTPGAKAAGEASLRLGWRIRACSFICATLAFRENQPASSSPNVVSRVVKWYLAADRPETKRWHATSHAASPGAE